MLWCAGLQRSISTFGDFGISKMIGSKLKYPSMLAGIHVAYYGISLRKEKCTTTRISIMFILRFQYYQTSLMASYGLGPMFG